MQTLDLNQAAAFLLMSAEGLRRKAKAGQIPGRKAGRSWVFVREHLAEWISSGQNTEQLNAQRIGGKPQEKITWQSTNAEKRGGSASPITANEYNELLGLSPNNKPKSCTTK